MLAFVSPENPLKLDSVTHITCLNSTQATRMISLGTRQGVHLVAAALLNAPNSQLSASEIYEWLAEKYPRYQYTKTKVRHVLRHDSERQSPRFVIANEHRPLGVPIRWTIRPGTENQLRQLFNGPPPPEPLHCVLCNQVFDRHESFVRHQREAHSSDLTEPLMHTQESLSTFVENSPSVIWDDFQEREAEEARELQRPEASRQMNTQESTTRVATPITSTRRDRTRDHQSLLALLSTIEAADRNEAVQSPDAVIGENVAFQCCFKRTRLSPPQSLEDDDEDQDYEDDELTYRQPLALVAADQEWEICGVLDHKNVDGIEYFLVDWVPTWVREHECGNVRAIMEKYKVCGRAQSKNMNKQDRWPLSKAGQQEVAGACATCNVQRKRGWGRPRKQSARGHLAPRLRPLNSPQRRHL